MALVCERKTGVVQNYFLSTCYMPETILGAWDTAVSKVDKTCCFHGLYVLLGVEGSKKRHTINNINI